MRAAELGQNFLRNQRTARRLVHMAGEPSDLPCVDLGAGRGMITTAALRREGRVIAIETDPRLAAGLRTTYADEPRVEIVEQDLMEADLPAEPFVIAANPPFNLSTQLVRRWMMAQHFVSGALIVERPFGQRVSGEFGATKLSLSLAPFLDLGVPVTVRAAEFTPQPRVAAAILTGVRRTEPAVPSRDRVDYWRFVNYLFERSRPTVGEALAPLRLGRGPTVESQRVRDLTPQLTVQIFSTSVRGNRSALGTIAAFEERLPAPRRSDLARRSAPPRRRPRRPAR
jgi:16S rRNA A1518/A1519 N6-dimethyltransferase RsmA/KsgA/DIM1 with predicted DNA glycosylase/AP lyase activity